MATVSAPELTEQAIATFAVNWYEALDRHDDLDSVQALLADEGLEMRFPEVTSRGHDEFAAWYLAVTTRFFDEQHTVRSVGVQSIVDGVAQVKVLVNWQCKGHDAQDAQSKWFGFDSYQTWTVIAGPAGPQIRVYGVDRMVPMPGSAEL
jgi:SnoaL-like protein